MAALAYLLPPVTGMLAFFSWAGPRIRFHGAQAICFGLAWALLLYLSSAISATITQVVFALGVLLWLTLIGTTAIGRDLRLPLIGAVCARTVGLEERS